MYIVYLLPKPVYLVYIPCIVPVYLVYLLTSVFAGDMNEHEAHAFTLPPELADPQKSPCVNVPEWFVREGGELCLSDTANGTSVIR